MWKFIVICTIVGIMESEAVKKTYVRSGTGGYVGSSAGSYAGAGGYAGGYTGGYTGGYGGGYGGGYIGGYTGTGSGPLDGDFVETYNDDYDDYDSTGGIYAPSYGLSAAFLDPYIFHQQLTAQIHAQHAAQQNALAKTNTIGDGTATASASVLPNNDAIQRQLAAQQAYFDAIRRRNHISGGGYNVNRYAPGYAAASASTGPGGYYQSASIHPSSGITPNIVNRFSTGSGPGGYKGVSVSSFSSSSDINGKRTGVRGAQTTVNDNGKITTYSVHS